MNKTWVQVYGRHSCLAILKNFERQIQQVLIRQGDEQRHQELIELATQRKLPIHVKSSGYFKQHFGEQVHQGVVISVCPLKVLTEQEIAGYLQALLQPAFILILDGITDPHNLGACLRTADAVGVDLVIIPKDKSADLGAIVTKVSSGASESVMIARVTNLARTMEHLQDLGVWIYGACGEAKSSLYDLDGQRPLAVVVGAEGFGLRRLTREKCDQLFSIPMCGSVSSLNVSVAAGVSLYEIHRQRHIEK